MKMLYYRTQSHQKCLGLFLGVVFSFWRFESLSVKIPVPVKSCLSMAVGQKFGGSTELGCAGEFELESIQAILSLDCLSLQQTFQLFLV